MKLFCRCIEHWLMPRLLMNQYDETRQILSGITCDCNGYCGTHWYWYNADYENMMFDLRRMNQC